MEQLIKVWTDWWVAVLQTMCGVISVPNYEDWHRHHHD